MKTYLLPVVLICSASISSCQQTTSKATIQSAERTVKVGGGCEGCEAIYECPVTFDKLDFKCRLPDWNEIGNRLAVNGTVYNGDGKPAAGVIIYVYHTDQTGHYTSTSNDTGWGKRHGRLRGWMKTNDKGEYSFMTLKPVAYPNGNIPAHIHVTIKEPDKNEYWIDEYVFEDDPLLTKEERKKCENRGGSGILHIVPGNILQTQRNIYLGKNIPAYPQQ